MKSASEPRVRGADGEPNVRRRAVLRGGAALLVVAVVVAYLTLPTLPAEVLYQLVAWGSIGVLVVGIWRRARAVSWLLIALGYAAFAVGDLLFTVYDLVLEEAPLPSVADVAYLAGYPLMVTGLLLMVHHRQPRGDRTALLDAGLVAVSCAVLTWVNLIQPFADDPELSLLTKLILAAYPAGDLLVLAVLVRLVFGLAREVGRPPRALVSLVATTVVMMAADVAFLIADLNGAYTSRGWIDGLYLLSYAGLVFVGLDPTLAKVDRCAQRDAKELTPARLGCLVAAALLTPAVVLIEALHGRTVAPAVIVLGTSAGVILVAMRMAGLLRSLEASRDALSHESTHDSLTGIANRTLFSRRLTDVLTEGRRCSVVLIDLDGFKAVNDEHGHLMGDALLVEAATRLSKAVRLGDLCARFGGDEFAVLLPDTTPDIAQRVTERVAEMLNVDVELNGHVIPLRASVGLAHWDASSTTGRSDATITDAPETKGVDRLLAAADRAMYQAKRQRARHLVLVSSRTDATDDLGPDPVVTHRAGTGGWSA